MNYGTLSAVAERRIEHFSSDPEFRDREMHFVVKERPVAWALLMTCKKEISRSEKRLFIDELRKSGGLLFYGRKPAIAAARRIINTSE